MALLIDTGVVPARQRAEFWSQASCEVYHPLEIRTHARERFAARMWGDEVASVGVFRIAAEPNTMRRTQRTIAAGDPECLHVTLLLRGHMRATQQDRTDILAPGDITSYNTSRPAVMAADEAIEVLVLRLPRALLGPAAARIEALTALRIPGTAALTRLTAQFLVGIAAAVAGGEIARDDANAAERVIDLVRGLYSQRIERGEQRRSGSSTELLLGAKAVIEAGLVNPDLGPEEVARACFISTRYLHRLFECEGLSVCDWIRAERLDRCRRDLQDPSLAGETILSIASRWGLPSSAHFSRLFRAAYGCSPREHRQAATLH
jgi:AraC-like DNA-binding protein